jgi:hypothetical protein
MSGTSGSTNIVKLAPSSLTFLWEECQRCFWLSAHGVLKRPSAPFPKVFTMLDNQTKDFYFNKRSEEMAEGLRPGHVALGDRWVRSRPLSVPGHDTKVTLQGRIDTALSFDDGTHAIIDFKTSSPKAEHVPFYGRQLHSYALAAENPAEGALELIPVSQLGLLCVEPVAMIGVEDAVAYKGGDHSLPGDRARRRRLHGLPLPGDVRPGEARTAATRSQVRVLHLPRNRFIGPADRELRRVARDFRAAADR